MSDKEKWTYWEYDKKGNKKARWTRGVYLGVTGTNIVGVSLHGFMRPSGWLMIPTYQLTNESRERIRKEYPDKKVYNYNA